MNLIEIRSHSAFKCITTAKIANWKINLKWNLYKNEKKLLFIFMMQLPLTAIGSNSTRQTIPVCVVIPRNSLVHAMKFMINWKLNEICQPNGYFVISQSRKLHRRTVKCAKCKQWLQQWSAVNSLSRRRKTFISWNLRWNWVIAGPSWKCKRAKTLNGVRWMWNSAIRNIEQRNVF